jgi:hypothetical protein
VRWTDLGDGALTIGRVQTKASARRSRVITGPPVAVGELRAWQLESGGRGSDPIVGDARRLWGYKCLRPAVKASTSGRVTDATTYTLRHSHASACHYVGTLTVPEICRRLGHSQQTHFLHYARQRRALPRPRRACRGGASHSDVPPGFRSDRPRALTRSADTRFPLQFRSGRSWTRTRDLFLIREADASIDL